MKIESIKPEGYVMKGVYTPAKKIDLGNSYLIFVSGVQALKEKLTKSQLKICSRTNKISFSRNK